MHVINVIIPCVSHSAFVKISNAYNLNLNRHITLRCSFPTFVSKMAVSGANLHNVFMLLTLEPLLARNPFLVLHVRRDHLVSDALRELTVYSDVDLKKPLKVRVMPLLDTFWFLKSLSSLTVINFFSCSPLFCCLISLSL